MEQVQRGHQLHVRNVRWVHIVSTNSQGIMRWSKNKEDVHFMFEMFGEYTLWPPTLKASWDGASTKRTSTSCSKCSVSTHRLHQLSRHRQVEQVQRGHQLHVRNVQWVHIVTTNSQGIMRWSKYKEDINFMFEMFGEYTSSTPTLKASGGASTKRISTSCLKCSVSTQCDHQLSRHQVEQVQKGHQLHVWNVRWVHIVTTNSHRHTEVEQVQKGHQLHVWNVRWVHIVTTNSHRHTEVEQVQRGHQLHVRNVRWVHIVTTNSHRHTEVEQVQRGHQLHVRNVRWEHLWHYICWNEFLVAHKNSLTINSIKRSNYWNMFVYTTTTNRLVPVSCSCNRHNTCVIYGPIDASDAVDLTVVVGLGLQPMDHP